VQVCFAVRGLYINRASSGLHSLDCVLLQAFHEAKSGTVRSGHFLRWRIRGFGGGGAALNKKDEADK